MVKVPTLIRLDKDLLEEFREHYPAGRGVLQEVLQQLLAEFILAHRGRPNLKDTVQEAVQNVIRSRY